MGSAAPSSPCDTYHLLFHGETLLSNGVRVFIYTLALAYCFIGLSAITARFFKSMESIMKQSREVVTVDPHTKMPVTKQEKVWNYTIADVALLAFGTSFPQISLATIDAIRNLGQLTAGGLGPGTLVGSAAFDLFPIHAVCVIMPRAGSLKKISDLGVWLVELFWSFWAYIWLYIILEVWTPRVITLSEALLTVLQYGLLLLHAYAQDKRWPYVSIPFVRSERPEEWVPEEEVAFVDNQNSDEIGGDIVDTFSMPFHPNAEVSKRGDMVQVDTWVAASGKNGMRQDWHVCDYNSGQTILSATSLWVMMNKKTRRLSKMPEEVRAELGPHFNVRSAITDEQSEKLAKRGNKVDGGCTKQFIRKGLTPRWSDLDVNQHVNNVKYIGWILESAPISILEKHELASMTLNYRKECGRDSVLQSLTAVIGDCTTDGGQETVAIQCGHLLQLESGADIVKAHTEWRPKGGRRLEAESF